MSSTAETVGPAKGKVGHPGGLYVLFGAEMWERFSYYGMRALLVLYLTNHLQMAREDALAIYATYTGLVYLTPLLGGYLADKVLGQRKAILIGGIVMALGHFAMAFEPLLNLALGLLIMGNGFFKPNISTMVGQLYPQGDARRDGAYTIFYMGINLGALFSPLVCGTLGERVGWHWGFGAAGVGMVCGLISFVVFQKLLVGGYPPGREEHRLTAKDYIHVTIGALLCLGLVWGFLEVWPSLRGVWSPTGRFADILSVAWGIPFLLYRLVLIVLLVAVVLLATRLLAAMLHDPQLVKTTGTAQLDATTPPESDSVRDAELDASVGEEKEEDPEAPFNGVQWQRIAVILIVAIFTIFFWMGFEQSGGTLNLFADNRTERLLFGLEFPTSWFQSLNPLLILILAPLFSMLWTALDRTRFSLSSVAKMGLGLILLGLAFLVMYAADRTAGPSGKVGPQWLASVYLIFTMGELCLSPIGLSLVNKLAPARVASLMMALWFTCTAAGELHGRDHGIAGRTVPPEPLDVPGLHLHRAGRRAADPDADPQEDGARAHLTPWIPTTLIRHPRGIRDMRLILVLLMLCSLAAPVLAAGRPITVDDLLAVKGVSDPQVSPDGQWVVYVVSEIDREAGKTNSDLWLVPVAGGEPETTDHRAGDRQPPALEPRRQVDRLRLRAGAARPRSGSCRSRGARRAS